VDWLAAQRLGAELALLDVLPHLSVVKFHGENALVAGGDYAGIQMAVKGNSHARADSI
jgi:hypothetical protein